MKPKVLLPPPPYIDIIIFLHNCWKIIKFQQHNIDTPCILVDKSVEICTAVQYYSKGYTQYDTKVHQHILKFITTVSINK